MKYLLMSGNTMLFNEKLEIVVNDESIPVVKVCKEVEKVFDKKKNDSSINLAEEFKYFANPEYGYYQNRLFMGALAFAMRPYIDRLYTSGSGQRIDKTVMKDIVVAIFNYWENSKFNDKFVVRMSTEEERALTDKLNMIFGISDQDGLLGTKWAIRTKFQNQSKAPLWALKYVGNCSDKYKVFIDKMFKFSKSIDENIQQSFIVELLEGIKTFDVELSSAVLSVENSQCLDNFILLELNNIGESETSLHDVKSYLGGQMSGDIVFWEEDDVHEQILLWKIKKNTPASSRDEDQTGDNSIDSSLGSEPLDETRTSDSMVEKVRDGVRKKIEISKDDSEKLYLVLIALAEKYPYILEDINDLL